MYLPIGVRGLDEAAVLKWLRENVAGFDRGTYDMFSLQWFGDVYTGDDGSFVKTRDHWTKIKTTEYIDELENAIGEWEEMTDYASQAENGTLESIPGYSESDPQAILPKAVIIRLSTARLPRQELAFFEEQGKLREKRRKATIARHKRIAAMPKYELEKRKREASYRRGIIRNGERIRPVETDRGTWIPLSKAGWKFRRKDGTFGKAPPGVARPPPFKVKRKRKGKK